MKKALKRISSYLLSTASILEIHVLASIFSFSLFGYILLVAKIMQPDLDDHIEISNRMMKGEMIGHPFFFFFLQLFSFFSGNINALVFAAFLCFSVAQYGKIIQSIRLCETIREKQASRLLIILILGCQIAIGFLALQIGYVKGSLSPNFFHNGTLLLSIPPSLYLLNESILFIKDKKRKGIFRMLLSGILILLIKPSFLFCWIPVMPVFVLITEGAGRKFMKFLQISATLFICLLAQSLFLKSSSIDFKVVFDPFFLFGTIKNHFFVFIAACTFPIVTIIPGWSGWKTGIGLLLAMMTLQGLVLSFCFYDKIKNIVSANMIWQSSIIHYILLLYGSLILTDLLERKKFIYAILPIVALLAQVLSGVQYLRLSIFMRTFFF